MHNTVQISLLTTCPACSWTISLHQLTERETIPLLGPQVARLGKFILALAEVDWVGELSRVKTSSKKAIGRFNDVI